MNSNKIIEYFKDLTFDPECHKYYVGNHKIKESVSNIVGNYSFKVDWVAKAKQIDLREGLEIGTTFNKWEKIKKEACDNGHRVHEFGENYVPNRNITAQCSKERALQAFIEDLPKHLRVEYLELRMYHKKALFAGTADLILKDKNSGEYVLADYKTNKDLFKNFKGQKLLAPFEFLLDNPFNKYQLQLSLYQILLEQTGVKVKSRVLVWVKDDGTYEMYKLENLTKELKQALKLDEN